jgi:hypothetical protein
LAFERYYRVRPPRPFVYYLFYPLLFPYWLTNRDARREFLVFRGYTVGGFLVLVVTSVWQYWVYWWPELGVRQYLPSVLLALLVEMLLALSLLMPIATTVVWYHGCRRRERLVAVLSVGFGSALCALFYLQTRRDSIVSYSTRERVIARTQHSRQQAQRTLLAAAWAARRQLVLTPGVEGDGKVTGLPLERARAALQKFYRRDEATAFDVWARPRDYPKVLVIYVERSSSKSALWLAIDERGRQIVERSRLPRGLFASLHAASDGSEDLLEMLPGALQPDVVGPNP